MRMKPDITLFKHCMSKFVTGVTVVSTTTQENIKMGVTVNSFNSVSLNPLLVLFSLNKYSHAYKFFENAQNCTINILSKQQSHISQLFTVANPDNWLKVETSQEALTNSPAIKGCLAFLECEIFAKHDGGDHTIFVCKVINIVEQSAEDPLIYYSRQYRTISDEHI